MRISLLVSALLSFLTIVDASACPKVGNLPDFNCDGEINIVVIGDSLVSGYGDTANNNKGGYVLRAQSSLQQATVKNFGVPGLNTVQLLLNLGKAFRGTSYLALAAALVEADLVVLDLGRNDRWFFGVPLQTFRRITLYHGSERVTIAGIDTNKPFLVGLAQDGKQHDDSLSDGTTYRRGLGKKGEAWSMKSGGKNKVMAGS